MGVVYIVYADIAYAVIVTQVGERIDIEEGSRINSSVKHEAEVTVPVAIDVLWTRDGTTSLRDQRSLVADRVAGRREIHESHHGTLVVGKVVVIEEAEILRERRLQTWVTTCDTQWITVVNNIKQITH